MAAQSVAAGCNGTMQVYGFGMILIAGSFAPDGASAIGTVKGKGFTAAWTSTGLFTITFTRTALAVISCWCTPQAHVTADLNLQFGDIDVVTARTAVIKNAPAGVVADFAAANAQNRVHFGFLMATSSLNT